MAPLFRAQTTVSCFFCQSDIKPSPKNPRSFKCPHCSCWNRYDSNGEILSDDPAMHDEALNSRAFAKRASPSKSRLPTSYTKGPLCRTCQTNQMLLMNLLSNYLPSPESPEYNRRLEMLPEYRESLHRRYPPVCDACLPAVEEEIKKKDHMARTKALGGWLQESKGKEKQRRVSGQSKQREHIKVELIAWKVRGSLWISSLVVAGLADSIVTSGYWLPRRLRNLQPALPFLVLTSILWTFWDPTYSSVRTSQLQGRDVRITGKSKYIALQMTTWIWRMLTAVLVAIYWFSPDRDYLQLTGDFPSLRSRTYFSISLAIELLVTVASLFALRIQRPPPIRLIDTKSHNVPSSSRQSPTSSARPSPAPAELDLLTTLSLSSKPVIAATNPIFGLPSLSVPPLPSPSNGQKMDVDDEDAMDWTPTNASPLSTKGKQKASASDDDGSWLRPQRFFPPEKPTGLEGLFERTRLVDDKYNPTGPTYMHIRNFIWWLGLLLVPLVAGLAYWAWEVRRTVTYPTQDPQLFSQPIE